MNRVLIVDDDKVRGADVAKYIVEAGEADNNQWECRVIVQVNPVVALDDLKQVMKDPDWMQPFLIALDVKFPAEPFGGLTVIYDALLRDHRTTATVSGRWPWGHVFIYTIYKTERAVSNDLREMYTLARHYEIPEDHIFGAYQAMHYKNLAATANRLVAKYQQAVEQARVSGNPVAHECECHHSV